jgi:hypothetical protein
MADRAIVYFGPRTGFDELVGSRVREGDRTVGYLDAIRSYNAKIRASDLASHEPRISVPDYVDNCVVHADDFGSVLSHVIANFATILEETYEVGTLFVQNPPRRALESLVSAQGEDSVEQISYRYEQVEKGALEAIYDNVCEEVLGQEESKRVLVASLYRLSVMGNGRPSVVLLYGPSGVGKTETARCLSKALGGKLMRIQFSMMQTQEAYEYLFGAEHSKASLARDLLGRESNVVLIDEFDKVSPTLYNMFYQLFDEGRYVDTNYDVDMRGGLFLLTTNFKSERDARRAMGSAMFSRISACVAFSDLSDENKATIATRHYQRVVDRLDGEDRSLIENSGILSWFVAHASRYDNMRTMKNKIEKAIFERLSEPIFNRQTTAPSVRRNPLREV